MKTASLIIDIHKVRCGECKVFVRDELALQCPFCDSTFDRAVSNHVGLSQRLISRREAAGIRFKNTDAPQQAVEAAGDVANAGEHESTSSNQDLNAPIVVDIYNIRCGNCKVIIDNQLAQKCEFCGAVLDRIVSNHVGLAAKLQQFRLSDKETSENFSAAIGQEELPKT